MTFWKNFQTFLKCWNFIFHRKNEEKDTKKADKEDSDDPNDIWKGQEKDPKKKDDEDDDRKDFNEIRFNSSI